MDVCAQAQFDRVDILGEVADTTLVAEIERADILSCLRKPVLEGASASAIEGMKSGRPIIVADAGFYADLPDDLVFKVSAAVEIASLTALLERLAQDEGLCRDAALRAKDWAMRTFTAKAYVDVLEDLIAQLIDANVRLALAKRVGHELASLGISDSDPAVARLAETMTGLFGGSR